LRFSQTDADAPPPVALGPHGRPVEIFTYPDGDADACRRVLGTALRRIIDAGRVPASDVVILTPRSNRSSWLMRSDGSPVEAWPYRLMPEYGPEGSVLPPPTKGNEVRVATIHRYKGLESPVVVLAEIDDRVDESELAPLVYVGATRARSHLLIVASGALAARIGRLRRGNTPRVADGLQACTELLRISAEQYLRPTDCWREASGRLCGYTRG
jgi:hypothetical protein